jgi:hypothetical protein
MKNKDAIRIKAAARIPFKNGNLFGVDKGHCYAVYSYGEHFPLAVFSNAVRKWYINEDRYSPTTTRHQSLARQYLGGGTESRSTGWLKGLIAAASVPTPPAGYTADELDRDSPHNAWTQGDLI